MSFNRYNNLVMNGRYEIVPSIKISPKNSDYFEVYDTSKTRLDLISYKYYGDANYDWLIMLANPEYGSMEFDIPNGSVLRIPYPLELTLEQYNKAINRYKLLN